MDSCLRELRTALHGAIHGMSADDLAVHAEGKWSVAQILEHLYLTYTGTVKGCERCLREGRPSAGRPTLMQRIAATYVIKVGRMPEGRRSPDLALPRGANPNNILQNIGPALTQMDELIAKCEVQFGRRTKVMDHPILGPLSAGEWRKFHWVHGNHHLKQIRRLRAQNKSLPLAQEA